jgi:hypothetical protein
MVPITGTPGMVSYDRGSNGCCAWNGFLRQGALEWLPVTGTPGIVSYTEASAMVSYDRNP